MTQRVSTRTPSGRNGELIANSTRQRASDSFRVGKVRGDRRGDVWYLTYYEQGQRHRPRVGSDRKAAKQLAAQINGQLASHAPAVLSFQPVSIDDLRTRWRVVAARARLVADEAHESTVRPGAPDQDSRRQ